MTDDQIIYSVGRDMARFEILTGTKADAIVVSEEIWETLARSRWLVAKKAVKQNRITVQNSLLGLSLISGRSLDPEMYIVGMRCVVEEPRKNHLVIDYYGGNEERKENPDDRDPDQHSAEMV